MLNLLSRSPLFCFLHITLQQISFEGEAIDGGFAIDDITFYDGSCQSKFSVFLNIPATSIVIREWKWETETKIENVIQFVSCSANSFPNDSFSVSFLSLPPVLKLVQGRLLSQPKPRNRDSNNHKYQSYHFDHISLYHNNMSAKVILTNHII